MIRDYVHHKPAPRYRQHRQPRVRTPFFSFQMMAGAWAIIACALFLFGFHFKTESRAAEASSASSALILETAQPSTERSPSVTSKPRFDFYDVLTQQATKNLAGSRQSITTAATGQALHVVELGYFKDSDELQAMASRLRMAGFEPQITSSYSKQAAGRLFLGPYASEEGAISLKRALKEAGFKNTIVVEYSPS